MNDYTTQEHSTVLCECGCGQPTPIAIRNNKKLGHVKGQPVRFIRGHHVRLRPQRSIEERFWEKVDKRAPQDCWEWQGATAPYGYGQLHVDGRTTSAHRLSYEIHVGPIHHGLDCLHHCDNPACVNPAHLWVGTHQDNMDDMFAKGRNIAPPIRHAPGEKSPRALFTNAQVRAFRHEFAKSDMSMMAFARHHNVTDETMRKLLHGITYPDA